MRGRQLGIIALLMASGGTHAAELLTPTPILADGKTETTVFVALVGVEQGTPVAVRSAQVQQVSAEAIADGLVALTITPDPARVTKTVTLQLRTKGAEGRISSSLSLPLAPALTAPIEVKPSVRSAPMDGPPVELSMTLPPTPQRMASRRVLYGASAGELTPPEVDEAGTLRSVWTPPSGAPESEVVLLGFVDAAAPSRVFGVTAVAATRSTNVTVETAPDSQNILIYEGASREPATASPSGTVAFDVEINPLSPTAQLESTAPGQASTVREVSLVDGRSPKLWFMPSLESFPSDPERQQTLLIATYSETGLPLVSSPPEVNASRGEVTSVSASEVPGVWSINYTPPDTPGSTTLRATLDQHSTETRLTLVSPADSVSLKVAPDPVNQNEQVSVTVSGSAQSARVVSVGAQQTSRPRKTPQGTAYVLTPEPEQDGLWILTLPEAKSVGQYPSIVNISAAVNAPPDGRRPITVSVMDSAGLPVPDVPITAAAGSPLSEGSPSSTDESGIAHLWVEATDEQTGVLRLDVGGLPAGAYLGSALPTALQSDYAPTRWVEVIPPEITAAEEPTPDEPVFEPVDTTTSSAPIASSADLAPPTEPSDSAGSSAPPATGRGHHIGIIPGVGGHVWRQDAADGVAGPETRSRETTQLPLGIGVAGLAVSGTAYTPQRRFGLTTQFIAQRSELTQSTLGLVRGHASLLARQSLTPRLSGLVHAGYGVTTGVVYVYEDGDPDDDTPQSLTISGGELGAGVAWDGPSLHANLTLHEFLAPWPIQTGARLQTSVPVASSVWLAMHARVDRRTMAFDVDNESIETTDMVSFIGIGAEWRP